MAGFGGCLVCGAGWVPLWAGAGGCVPETGGAGGFEVVGVDGVGVCAAANDNITPTKISKTFILTAAVIVFSWPTKQN